MLVGVTTVDCVMSLKEVPIRLISYDWMATDSETTITNLRAKDIWHVKHLKGLTFVSVDRLLALRH